MKLKTLLSVMYYENVIHFIVQDEEMEMICEFHATAEDKKLDAYGDCWVAMVDMDCGQIIINQ